MIQFFSPLGTVMKLKVIWHRELFVLLVLGLTSLQSANAVERERVELPHYPPKLVVIGLPDEPEPGSPRLSSEFHELYLSVMKDIDSPTGSFIPQVFCASALELKQMLPSGFYRRLIRWHYEFSESGDFPEDTAITARFLDLSIFLLREWDLGKPDSQIARELYDDPLQRQITEWADLFFDLLTAQRVAHCVA